jgi:hypothetical protein
VVAYHRFEELPDLYESSLAAAERRSLFLSRPWFDNYIATVAREPARVRLFAVAPHADPTQGAILPVYEPKPAHRLAARRLESLANYYTSRYEPLTALPPEDATEAIDALVGELFASATWDLVKLAPLYAEGPLLGALREAFRRRGCLTHEYFCFENWHMDVRALPDFAAYLESRGSQIRKTTARRVRQFERDPANHFTVVTGGEELEPALAAYDAVYRRRWGKNEPFPRFIPGLARSAAEHGWLRLGVAWVGDEPAAVQLWIVKDGVAYMYKVAFDSRFGEMSIGSVALFKMIEHVMEHDRVAELDFLTGDDAYKRDWVSDRRELHGLLAFNTHTARGLAAASRHMGGHYLAGLARRVRAWSAWRQAGR